MASNRAAGRQQGEPLRSPSRPAFCCIQRPSTPAYCKCSLEFVANKVKWQRLLQNSTSTLALHNSGKNREKLRKKLGKNWQFNIWRFLRDLFKQYTWEFVLMLRRGLGGIREGAKGYSLAFLRLFWALAMAMATATEESARGRWQLAIMALNFY